MDDMTARARAKPKGRAKAPPAVAPAAPPRRVAVQISGRLDAALERLAAETGKPKSLHLRKALERYIEDTYDILLAEASLRESGRRYTSDEIRKLLALEDRVQRRGASAVATPRCRRAAPHPRFHGWPDSDAARSAFTGGVP